MSVEFDPTLVTLTIRAGPPPGEAAGRPAGADPAEGPGLSGAREAADADAAPRSESVSVRFRVDRATDRIVVSVVDEATGEVVRQIPAEEQLAIGAHLRALQGLLFSRIA